VGEGGGWSHGQSHSVSGVVQELGLRLAGQPFEPSRLLDDRAEHLETRRAESADAQGDAADLVVPHGRHELDLGTGLLGHLPVDEVAGRHTEEGGQGLDGLQLRVHLGPRSELLDGARGDGDAGGVPDALRHFGVRVGTAAGRVHLAEEVVEQLGERSSRAFRSSPARTAAPGPDRVTGYALSNTKGQVIGCMTWPSGEPPSGFEPETYALRGHGDS